MTTATDDFNRSDGGIGGNYTSAIGAGLTVASNQCTGTSSAERASLRTNETFTADQTVTFTLISTASSAVGVLLRATGADGTLNCYKITCGFVAGYDIERVDAGSTTSLKSGSVGTDWASGNSIEVSIAGTTITLKRGGSTIDTATDSTYSSAGAPGLYIYNTGVIDDVTFQDSGGGGGGSANAIYYIKA